MKILETPGYTKDYKKKLQYLHKYNEIENINEIKELILDSENLKCLMDNPLRICYGIEQKKGTLKEIFTADINKKLRLYMKPVGTYPYNCIEIIEMEFLKVDDKHYGEG